MSSFGKVNWQKTIPAEEVFSFCLPKIFLHSPEGSDKLHALAKEGRGTKADLKIVRKLHPLFQMQQNEIPGSGSLKTEVCSEMHSLAFGLSDRFFLYVCGCLCNIITARSLIALLLPPPRGESDLQE